MKLSDFRPNIKRRFSMYEVFYNLKAEPFRLSPDHKFCYEHKGYAKARAYMAYAFKRAEGFVMITGRPGTGKTTLVGELVESLASDKVRTANLVCTQLQADDLLKTVAYSFGVSSKDFDKAELLQRLTTLFQRWHQEGGRALLIVDEAQDLSVSAMEELRLLTNIQIGGQPLVQIFLLGQPELRDLVMAPEMEQVHQRVIAASHLRGLEVDEAEAYVVHRLHKVGWNGDPAIDRAIFPLIHKFSEGVPRRINLICSRLFLLGSVEQRHKIEVADVRDVIGELQAENLAAGSWFSESDFDLTREPEWLEVPGAAVAPEPEPEPQYEPEPEPEPESELETELKAEPDEMAGHGDELGGSPEVEGEGSSDSKKKDDEEVGGAVDLSEPTGVNEAPSAAEDVYLEPDFQPEPESEPLVAVEDPSATVDVIEELFEIVTAQEHVDAPEYIDDFEDEMLEGHGGPRDGQERKYFSGSVIAETTLASEEAVSDLASLPEAAHHESGESDGEGEAAGGDLDSVQRDGKEWPLRSKTSDAVAEPKSRAKRAVAVLAFVALVGAGVFFLELYLSHQDQTAQAASGLQAQKQAATVSGELSAGPATKLSAEAASESGLEPEVVGGEAALKVPAEDNVVPADGMQDQSAPAAVAPLDGELSKSAGGDEAGVDEQRTVAEAVTESETVGDLAEKPAPGLAATKAAAAVERASDVSVQPVAKQVFVVNFDFDSAALGADASAVLSRAVQKLEEFPGSKATIASNVGGQTPGASASAMAEARASAVQRFFLSEGVASNRVSIENSTGQRLASSVSGQNLQRTVQVIVSRTIEG